MRLFVYYPVSYIANCMNVDNISVFDICGFIYDGGRYNNVI